METLLLEAIMSVKLEKLDKTIWDANERFQGVFTSAVREV